MRSSALRITLLLASTALTLQARPVLAQSAATGPIPASTTSQAPGAQQGAESVTVTGRSARTTGPGAGLMKVETAPKVVESITRDFIAKQSPTTNAQQLLKMLPSTNVTNADPFGLFSGTSRVRGLDTSEVGYVLEGAPLNDIGGGQFYSNEVVEAEDLNSVSLQPGSVNLDSPVVSATAGLVTMTMKDPAYKPGGLFDISYGSFKLNREYIRLDSGEVGHSGVRAFISFSHTHANNWEGPGGAEKKHIDFKLVKDFNNGSHTSLAVAYNDQTNDSYNTSGITQSNYLNLIEKGNSNSYLATWPGANGVKSASGAVSYPGTNFYKLHVNPFANVIASAPSTFVVTPRVHIDDTPYFWHGIGNGTSASAITEGSTFYGNIREPIDLNGDGRISSKTTVIALTPSNQEQFRPGNTVKGVVEVDRHNTVEAGWWYEYSNLLQYSPVGLVNQRTGIAENIWGTQDFYNLPNGRPYWYRDYTTITQINQLFLGDHARYFDDRLTVEAGFKEAMVSRGVTNRIPGTTYDRNLNVAEPLPQLALSWQFDKRNQVFVSGATNFRVPANYSLADQISNTTGKLVQTGGPSNSEYSIGEEVGYRYNGSVLIGSISYFHYNFTNKQLSLTLYVNGAPIASTVNAGGQTTDGVDIQLSTRPILFHLRPYVAFEYLNATSDNNVAASGTLRGKTIQDYLPTAGKQQVFSPHVQAKLGIDYDDGRLFAGTDLDYVSQQYSTLTNDQGMPDFITNNVYMGYRFQRWGYLKAPQIQLNMENLTGATFRNGVNSFATNANPTRGKFGSIITAGTPTYYLQPGFAAIATLSTAF